MIKMRKIKINNEWFSVGDTITLKCLQKFLFFLWYTEKKYVVMFIGSDSSALVSCGKYNKTITGEVYCYNI